MRMSHRSKQCLTGALFIGGITLGYVAGSYLGDAVGQAHASSQIWLDEVFYHSGADLKELTKFFVAEGKANAKIGFSIVGAYLAYLVRMIKDL